MLKKNSITNPVYKELLKNKIISKNHFLFHNKTRDKDIKVYKDNFSEVIFLEKFLTDINYYKSKKKNIPNKAIKKYNNVFTNSGTIRSAYLNDDQRRINFFKKHIVNKDVIDFGCGFGGFAKLTLKLSNSTSVTELRPDCIKYLKKNKKINFINNFFEDNKLFDTIFLFHVLEHIPNQILTLKNLRNKLKKNGKIIVEVPSAKDLLLNIPNLKEFKDFSLWSEHLILHSFNSLEKVLKLSGFKKIKITYFQRYNFNNHLNWFINKKPSGQEKYLDFFDKNFSDFYCKYLEKKGLSDTLIGYATK
jgi:2-polyprenyl-3-methyl-5-hydroxy-6-metoxy-1,4-benzoquinol methylase